MQKKYNDFQEMEDKWGKHVPGNKTLDCHINLMKEFIKKLPAVR